MTTRQALPYVVDKTLWRRGPWDEEDDAELWTLPNGHTGLLARNPEMGVWCGYVGLPPEQVPRQLPPIVSWNDSAPGPVGVHDLVPQGLHWVGFHCAHGGQYQPGPLYDMLNSYEAAASRICVTRPNLRQDGITEVRPGLVLVRGSEVFYVSQGMARLFVRLLDQALISSNSELSLYGEPSSSV